MSIVGGVNHAGTALPESWPRGVARNFAAAIACLTRRARGDARPVWRAYQRIALGTVGAVAMLLLIMVLVDLPMLRAARQLPGSVKETFGVITKFGLGGWFLIPLAIALLMLALVTSRKLTRMSQLVLTSLAVRLGFLFAAIALPGLFVTIIKRIIGRARPGVGGEDAFVYHLFSWRVEYASFPSGHATNAFAAAIAFGVLWPRLKPLLWSYAIAIALSRVIVNAHHPSDVVAGAIAGAVGALLVRDWLAARRLGFTIRPDGVVEAMPGPSLTRLKRVARTLAGQ